MDYVRLGSTGMKVSRLCLGCMSFGGAAEWTMPEADGRIVIRQALDAGINFFDTANIYGHGESEEILGRALKGFGVPRTDSVIATKVYFPMGAGPNDRGLSRKHILHSVDESLARLGTDYIDLLQIHRFDEETPIEETLKALDDVVRAGKVRYLGASTMAAWQFAKMLFTADRMGTARFVSMQNCYNLLYREEEREVIPLCIDQKIGLIPYSPLSNGILAGSRKVGSTRSQLPRFRERHNRPSDQEVVDAVDAVSAERGVPSAQIAIAWLLSRPGMTAPIVGMSKLGHLDDPLKALDLKLTPEEFARLEGPYVTQPAMGPTPVTIPKPRPKAA